MRKIRIRDIEDGMVLGQDIEDAVGRTLLNRGDTLKNNYIQKLESWGIMELIIKGSQEEEIEKLKASSQSVSASVQEVEAQIESVLEAKFARVSENPRMREVRLVAKKHLMRRALTQPNNEGAAE